jgi:hypothetical protein
MIEAQPDASGNHGLTGVDVMVVQGMEQLAGRLKAHCVALPVICRDSTLQGIVIDRLSGKMMHKWMGHRVSILD